MSIFALCILCIYTLCLSKKHSVALKYAKMRWRPGLCPGPRWGSSQHSASPHSRPEQGYPPTPHPTARAKHISRLRGREAGQLSTKSAMPLKFREMTIFSIFVHLTDIFQ